MVRPSSLPGIILRASLLLGVAGFLSSAFAQGADNVGTDAQAIARGRELAALGGCLGCHSRPGGPSLAGGAPLNTPFGTLYGTNITPAPSQGLGFWSESDFVRAMRIGRRPDGGRLYPAFPYDHFTLASDSDLHDLYLWLRSVPPVPVAAQDPQLIFPFSIRPLLGVWDWRYVETRRFVTEPSRSEEWNRGKYLVESLGHCGACHSPRNVLGAEDRERPLAGGSIDGWYAPPLDARNPSPVPWSVDALALYLQTGIAPEHAIAGGPMQRVAEELGRARPSDVRAMAVFLEDQMNRDAPRAQKRGADARERARRPLLVPAADDAIRISGAQLYRAACANCHASGRALGSSGGLQLPLAIALYEDDPHSLIAIIKEGIRPAPDALGRWMPGFDGMLTDDEIVALAAYLRSAAAAAPPWPTLGDVVKERP